MYERTLGNMPVSEFIKAIEDIIDSKMTKIFLKYLPDLQNYIEAKKSDLSDLVDTNTVCSELRITRQTLNNWFKKQATKNLLNETSIKKGNRNMYNLNEIKKIIKSNKLIFGKGNDYEYKENARIPSKTLVSLEAEAIINENLSELSITEIYEKMKGSNELTEKEQRILRKYE